MTNVRTAVDEYWHAKLRLSGFTAWVEDICLEPHKELLSYLDHEAEYITKAQYLDALDMLMRNLMRICTEETQVVDSNYNH